MTSSPLKTYFIRTYGCQMNELDAEIMAGMLEQRGLTRAATAEEADLLLLNTCSIRDLAERKVMGKLGLMPRERKRNVLVGITGCMANSKKEALFDKFPHVDFVLGTNNIHELNVVLDEAVSSHHTVLRADAHFHTELDYECTKRDDPIKAYVSIIRGCNKHCTYCVVPYTRGKEVSRPPETIIQEVKALLDKGYKEITLLGQNVNSYGKDRPEWQCLFHDLLYRLDALPGLLRLRFLTSHPVDISPHLVEALRDLKTLCEYVHFPLQAGSNRILRKMHRSYTVEQYLDKVHALKEAIPHICLGTDIIVGFPTETEEEFLQTCHLLRWIRYSAAFLFAYSARKGTPAMRWTDDISEEVKEDRLRRLTQLQGEVETEQRQQMLGKTVEVLVESRHPRDNTLLKGRTRGWQKVAFPGDSSLIGSLQQVTLHSFSHQTLLGKVD